VARRKTRGPAALDVGAPSAVIDAHVQVGSAAPSGDGWFVRYTRLILRHRAKRAPLVRTPAAPPAPPAREPPPGVWIDDRKLAAWIGLSRVRLQALRRTPHGPPFVRVGKRAVRYSTDAVRAWLATRAGG
jgi:predicted DNA-binding transcriptional regulator AlpA